MRGAGSALRLERPRDVQAFEDLASAFLRAREAENCLILGLCSGIHVGRFADPPPYFAVARARNGVAGAAMRTPPFNLLLSDPIAGEAIRLIADDAFASFPDLAGVLGPKETAGAFAGLWRERTGRVARVKASERVFRLTRVIPPAAVGGGLRPVGEADRSLLAAWLRSFAREALGEDRDPAFAELEADRWIAGFGRRSMYLWDDGGAVSITGVGGETPSGIKIAPVYTPPELRGRGYASALVAAVSQRQLESGRRYCFLFTDLANPTSNKIYQAVGYEPVLDVDEYRFEGRATHASADT